MSLLPPDDDLDLIHTRRYETRVYQVSDEELLVRGAVSDMKPPGLYILGDPEPMEIHQMQLELRVALPNLEITSAHVVFETHPNSQCPIIANDYEKLVGLSIARGFTREIRNLFGGPNGCTHTNALLQALAPAVVQATWSVSVRNDRLTRESETTASSAGREGPIVQVGSALGSTLGQVLHFSAERVKILVACGAAAGIAADGGLGKTQSGSGDLVAGLPPERRVAQCAATTALPGRYDGSGQDRLYDLWQFRSGRGGQHASGSHRPVSLLPASHLSQTHG